VRFYEAESILPTAPRSANGYRLYSTDNVECLQFIGRLRSIGLGLVDIREIMRLRAEGVPPPGRVIALLDAMLICRLCQRKGWHKAPGATQAVGEILSQ
jgi:DNA-binding transcriptional MerR regulator